MNRFVFIIVLFFATSGRILSAQNLLPNPGFEAYDSSIVSTGGWHFQPKSWKNVSGGRYPPYIRNESRFNGLYAKLQILNEYKSASGRACMLMYLYTDGLSRDFLSTHLAEPLVKGNSYHIEFDIRYCPEQSSYALDRIGILLSAKETMLMNFSQHGVSASTLATGLLSEVVDTLWHHVSLNYRAWGGEQYLTIGNFSPENAMQKKKVNPYNRPGVVSCYAFDNISIMNAETDSLVKYYKRVYDGDTPKTSAIAPDQTLFEAGKIYRFGNLLFDKARPCPANSSTQIVNIVCQYLLSNENERILIVGHTDSDSDEIDNMKLSRQRAVCIADLLESCGIPRNRIITVGLSEDFPLVANVSDDAKAQNRRVEILFLK
ncbi:MAG: OmpA family protein [Flavobacteriales bacterium]|nr:OmpA family protein [Flavobacteriales bacterium]